MRIAFNTRLLLPNRLEGIGWFTFETLKRITTAHPEHEFYFIFDRPYDAQFIFGKNVHPIVVSPPTRHPLLWYIWFEWRLPAIFKKYKIDVFASPDGYLSLRAKLPQHAVIHDINFEHHPKDLPFTYRSYYRYFFKKFAHKAARIATVSSYSAKDMVETYGLNASKIDVVYNGANEIYKPLRLEDKLHAKAKYANGKSYFMFIGSLHRRKNIHNMVAAFDRYKKLNNNETKLLIVGEKMWTYPELEAALSAMKFKEDVLFLGRLNPDELRLVIGASIAMLFVSHFEGFGIPIVEGMKCGVPIITSTTTSMPEVAGNAALLVNPFDVNEIAEAMQTIEKNPELRQKLVEQGLIHAQQFTWDNTAKLYWHSIAQLLP